VLDTVRLYVPLTGTVPRQAALSHGFELFPFWIGYFAIGVAAGRLLAERRGRGLSARPFLLAVPLATTALLLVDLRGAVNAHYGEGTGAFLRPLMVPLALAICGAVLFGAPALLRRMPRLAWATSLFSRHSLGVYIVHPLVLTVLGRELSGALHTHLPWSIGPWLAITVGTALGALLLTQAIAYTPLAVTLGEARLRWRARGERAREGELVGRRAQPARSPRAG
jgi:surface polysaccharide O-acyltransferase-like enzyme